MSYRRRQRGSSQKLLSLRSAKPASFQVDYRVVFANRALEAGESRWTPLDTVDIRDGGTAAVNFACGAPLVQTGGTVTAPPREVCPPPPAAQAFTTALVASLSGLGTLLLAVAAWALFRRRRRSVPRRESKTVHVQPMASPTAAVVPAGESTKQHEIARIVPSWRRCLWICTCRKRP